jgi:hypothetical protein
MQPVSQPQRPQAIRVLGILNVVLALLGVLGLLGTYAMYFGDFKIGPRNPVIELARSSPGYMSFLRWSFAIGGVRCALLLAGGLGLLGVKAWARKVNIAFALFGLVSGIASVAATYHYLIGPLSKSSDPGAAAGAFGGMAGMVLTFVYPLVILVFMMKQDVREALERASEPPIPTARAQ